MNPNAPPLRKRLGEFTITMPAADACVPLGPGNTVHVEVEDGGNHDSFQAGICCVSDPTMASASCNTALSQVGSSSTWIGDVPAGFLDAFDIPEDSKQLVVYGVLGGASRAKTRLFRITRPGSGSVACAGSGSQARCGYCADVPPLPVCLTLTHGGGITSAGCAACETLNAPALLVHANESCFSCCWFSGPIPFCGPNPGYWKLEKLDPVTWELRLRQARPDLPPLDVVVYRLPTAPGDCAFPITLFFQSVEMPGACSAFPDRITINPAP